MARIAEGLGWAFAGKRPKSFNEGSGTFFSPGEPIKPVADEKAKGRAFDYPFSVNTSIRPRANEPVDFNSLRTLADSYDILRMAIETRKDQMEKLQWSIMARKKAGQTKRPSDHQAECERHEKLFRSPDKEHSWNEWLRMVLEDMFVIDAPAIYIRRTLDGNVYGFEQVDGATITRMIAPDGRTPKPPLPAYQQILKGMPATEYTIEEMVYKPRNPRVHKIYGYSHVEQVIMTVNIALRRQVGQLQTFTEGNIPEAFIGVPPEWTNDQINEFQTYWDSIMEGNMAARRRGKFVPGNMNIQFTQRDQLMDQFDEWLARVICYCFSLPPFPFVKETNRATAETAHDAALEEGLAPLMQWVKNLIDYLLANFLNAPHLEFVWDDVSVPDPATQSIINDRYLNRGVLSIDEIREDQGREPLNIGHIIFGVGPAGFIMVEDLKDPNKRAALMGLANLSATGEPMNGDPLAGVPIEVLQAVGLAPPPPNPLDGVPRSILEEVGVPTDLIPDAQREAVATEPPAQEQEIEVDPLDVVPDDVLEEVGLRRARIQEGVLAGVPKEALARVGLDTARL